MRPVIKSTSFGSITVDKTTYDHDIIISSEGIVKRRKKKLSKRIYGTSHQISLDEIKYVYREESDGIVIGSGQYGVAVLSPEAEEYLKKKNCSVLLKPTPEAVQAWNESRGKWIGLFHITC
jgi:hypothetical protein